MNTAESVNTPNAMQIANIEIFDPAAFRWEFAQQRSVNKLRHKDAALALGVSEAQSVEAHVGLTNLGDAYSGGQALGLTATRLAGSFPELIESLEAVGPVMALTRNESAVHEKTGIYTNASHTGHMGLVLGDVIDLRLFYAQWTYGYFVEEITDKGTQHSVQFFDGQGIAAHKIFARPITDLMLLKKLVQRFVTDDQTPRKLPFESMDEIIETPDAAVDITAFHAQWRAMTDTHEFFSLMKRHALTRPQALRLAEPQFARRVALNATQVLLEAAAAQMVPIMVFVSNKACIQIHGGTVSNIAVMGPWLNVLDEDFNLHLRHDHIASSWVVRKPTSDGIVTSLEIFDAAGVTLAYFFGKRKPGQPEDEKWRTIVEAVQ